MQALAEMSGAGSIAAELGPLSALLPPFKLVYKEGLSRHFLLVFTSSTRGIAT